MLSIDPPQSLLKRSATLFRRLSRREPRSKRSTANPQAPLDLQRRATDVHPTATKYITHMTAIETPPIRRQSYDSRASSNTRRVQPSEMPILPFPRHSSHVHTVGWNVFLTPDQAYSLVMGSAPQAMEDKWFIYSEGPDTSGRLKVNFHRSWTGLKVATLFVLIDLKGEGAGKIVGIKWNGTDDTNGMDEEEAKYMIDTTCKWVLGVDLQLGLS